MGGFTPFLKTRFSQKYFFEGGGVKNIFSPETRFPKRGKSSREETTL